MPQITFYKINRQRIERDRFLQTRVKYPYFCASLLATYTRRSTTLLEYPHSLSYQATSLTKFLFKLIPAAASNIEDDGSPTKSVETTWSSVYPIIPCDKVNVLDHSIQIYTHFVCAFGCLLESSLDLIIRRPLLKTDDEVNNRNICGWDTERETTTKIFNVG